MTLVTPLAVILLLAYFFPQGTQRGDIPLPQLLLGAGTGALLNFVAGLLLNRAPRPAGVAAPHHFFFLPMQWVALAIMVVCGTIALLR